MSHPQITITPEQEAVLQEGLVRAWQPLMQMREQLRAGIPALRTAARLDEALRQNATATPPQ
ncbi:hypothetical protein ACWHA3_01105 [Streptomyces cyaneofuscatus]